MNSFYSARETGETIAQGSVEAQKFPIMENPTPDLASPPTLPIIKKVKRGNFVLDRTFMPGVSDMPTTAELIEIGDHGRTRELNGHGVVFGQLLLQSKDAGECSLHVAVKPFADNKEAAHEYSVASYIASDNMPHCDTFRPLGVMRFEDTGQPAVISHYRHSVRSMDGILWNPDLIDNLLLASKALGRAGLSLATVHSNDWTHGDAQAKNVAWDVLRPTDYAFVIDVETMQPVGENTPADKHEQKLKDVETFVHSLFLPEEDEEAGVKLPESYTDMIKQNFGLVYAGFRSPHSKTDDPIDYSTISRLVDQHLEA